MNAAPIVFDRPLLARRRGRAAASLRQTDFLLAEVADGLATRLSTVSRDFSLAVDLGAQTGLVGHGVRQGGRVGTIVATESSQPLLRGLPAPRLACDEEMLPFARESIDLVLSGLSLQWVNDLPGCLVQIIRALKPDGLLLAALIGGNSLIELRQALLEAESAIAGGASPRVAPFLDVREMGGLLQRAGFALPVVDADTLTVRYAQPLGLLRDLRAMGWTNALSARSRVPLRRDVLMRAMAIYAERHSDADGRVKASFEVIYASGWAPHESQQKPLKPGSARMRLADALGVEEQPAGDKASGSVRSRP